MKISKLFARGESDITNIITTKIEHKAVLNPVLNLSHDKKVDLEFLNIDHEGNPDLNQLESLLLKPKKSKVGLK